MNGGISFSPDGRRFAFIRGTDLPKLLWADRDGSAEHLVMDFGKTKAGSVLFGGGPSWSPDGRLIAVAVTRSRGEDAVFAFPVAGGDPIILSFPNAQSVTWVPDQSGLLITAPRQIWLQPWPKGTAQRITNDLNLYGTVRFSADGRRFVTSQLQQSNTIVVGPSSDPDAGVPLNASRSDGYGLAWMPDGRLLSMDREHRFWLATPGGNDRVPVLQQMSDVFVGMFSVCNGGRSLVSIRSNGTQDGMWTADSTGRNLKQLTHSSDDALPDCSPDGKWIIYSHFSDNQEQLMRIPAAGGSAQELGPKKNWIVGRYSPDGNRIGIVFDDGEGDNESWKSGIMDLQGRIAETYAIEGSLPPNGWQWNLRWTPDGRGLTFPLDIGDSTNLWVQSISGGKPRQITHFPDNVIAYAWSPDGKHLALAHRSLSYDAVLFSSP